MTQGRTIGQLIDAGARFRALAAPARRTGRPQLLLQTIITTDHGTVDEDDLVDALVPAWRRLVMEQIRTPRFLECAGWRAVDELIAVTYRLEGWDEVVMTPPFSVTRRELLVRRHGFGSVRFVECVKVCAPGSLVVFDDLRRFLATLPALSETSTAVISTSADFAAGLRDHPAVQPFLPARLRLCNRREVKQWLESAVARLQAQRGRVRRQ